MVWPGQQGVAESLRALACAGQDTPTMAEYRQSPAVNPMSPSVYSIKTMFKTVARAHAAAHRSKGVAA